jgi:hypothetical protein
VPTDPSAFSMHRLLFFSYIFILFSLVCPWQVRR